MSAGQVLWAAVGGDVELRVAFHYDYEGVGAGTVYELAGTGPDGDQGAVWLTADDLRRIAGATVAQVGEAIR